MSPASKSKPLRRNSTRMRRDATRPEDDAEHALNEIVAAQAKLTDQRLDSVRGLREKRTKSRY
jgi:hypothetical protein